MSPMYLMRYFRWANGKRWGLGTLPNSAVSASRPIRLCSVLGRFNATHGESTQKQNAADSEWAYRHDMDQICPTWLMTLGD